MSLKATSSVVVVCLILVLCAGAALGAGRSVTLSVDRNGVTNQGGQQITFNWSYVYDPTGITSCSGVFQILGPSPGNPVVFSQNIACGASSYTWTVPQNQAVGLYTAKVTFTVHWSGDTFCCARDFTDLAQVQFAVCCAVPVTFCKYLDLTGNGVKDNGDTPLSGWRFSVQKLDGTEVATGTTGTNGCVTIAVPMTPCDATCTTYYIKETPPDGNSGWMRTSPNPGLASERWTIQVCCGTPFSQDVLNWCPSRVQFCKFQDTDGDGTKDPGEQALPNWRFTVGGSTYTGGSDGCTQEIILASGQSVQVTEAPPVGDTRPWKRTTPPPAGAYSTPFNITTPSCGQLLVVQVGNYCPGLVRFCKFEDTNGNGTKDNGEAWLQGWTFTINGNNYTTGTNGCTQDIEVPVDVLATECQQTYQVTETPPAGDTRPWLRTVPSPGAASTPFSVTVPCCGSPTLEVLVGNWVPVTISGRKLQDVAPWPWTDPPFNNPANPAGYEPVPDCPSSLIPLQTATNGIQGVTISLRNATDTADILPPVVTDADGNFTFGPFHFGSVAPLTLIIKEGEVAAVAPTCNTNPDSLPVADLPQPYPWPGVYEATVSQSIWPCPTQNFGDAASPNPSNTLLSVDLPVPTVANQDYDYNYFYNRQPSRVWGQICPSTLALQNGTTPPLPNLTIAIEKIVNATPSNWPGGSANADTSTGIYVVPNLVEEPLPLNNLRAGTYRLTPPVPSDTRYTWSVTTYCAENVTIESSGTVTFDVPWGADVRVDFCLEEENDRRCFLPVTFTQQGWHDFCDPNSTIIPGGMIYNKFRLAFANYTFCGVTYHNQVIIGKGDKTITFDGTTSGLTRLCYFLPQTGAGGKLDRAYANPTTTSAGALAGELLALQMNIAYNDQRLMPRTAGYDFEKFIVAEGLFKGKTVAQVRNIANAVLGGTLPSSVGLPSPASAGYAALIEILANINANYAFTNFDTFVNGTYLIPNVPFDGNLKPPTAVVVPCP